MFIAFSMITGSSLNSASTADEARDDAVSQNRLGDADFIEVLDVGDDVKVWTESVLLHKARARHKTVWRGGGYSRDLPPVTAA